ncbi:MAG: type IV pili methyl-accepting chemotaxis transducer N-terminal domain-containing protein [Alcanivoracaceae bacterium]|nr:type IV pili methyl-accepting chemotaxis transducer N-terminal domain-containing protein [Alcanivoracaceae bacterium]
MAVIKKPTKTKKNSRYQSLIIFITLFVVIIVAVLTINFYFSSQFSDDAKEINLAGRQRMLSQRMAKNIQKLIQAQSSNEGIEQAFSELKSTFSLFDNTLMAFTKGGKTTGANGQAVTLKKVDIVASINAITAANKIWPEYKAAISKLIESDTSLLRELAEAIDYGKNQNLNILSMMDELTEIFQVKVYDGVYINLAARQRMLSQRIIKSLFELVNAQSSKGNINHLISLLKKDVEAFNYSLQLFLAGGDFKTADGSVVFLKAVKNKDIIELIKQTQKVWKPLSQSISVIVNGDFSIYRTLAETNDYANRENLNLLRLMNDLTVSLDQDSTMRADILRYVQIFGILLALVMFGFIVLFFLKHLRQADAELDQAKNETDRIFETVNDGLFLMDRSYMIGTQYSDSLTNIINVEQPAGKNFISILRKIVPENTLQTAKDYLELLYGDRVNADLVKDLNPLDEVEVYFGDEGLDKSVGHLGFEFSRVIKDSKISHLLVQVEDVTEKVKLEKELAESKDKAQAQFDLMLQVLHVQPDMLQQFLSETEVSLRGINQVLQHRTKGKNAYQEKLNSISRYMHRIKGDAAGLELQSFEQKAHDFEDLFENMKQQLNLSGKDFLPLVIKLDEFMSQIESLRALIAKLSELQGSIKSIDPVNSVVPHANNEESKISQKLVVLTQAVANKQNKKVILNVFNEHLLPALYYKPIHDILTQLIRNSIVHGIELAFTRVQLNKAEEGRIIVKFSKDPINNLVIEYSDDGKGLIEKEILDAAIEKGLTTKENSSLWDRKKIIQLIFKPGFSTKRVIDTDAGRGVGMDVIVDLVKQLSGRISVKSVDNKFFKFTIKLPEVKTTDTRNSMEIN